MLAKLNEIADKLSQLLGGEEKPKRKPAVVPPEEAPEEKAERVQKSIRKATGGGEE